MSKKRKPIENKRTKLSNKKKPINKNRNVKNKSRNKSQIDPDFIEQQLFDESSDDFYDYGELSWENEDNIGARHKNADAFFDRDDELTDITISKISRNLNQTTSIESKHIEKVKRIINMDTVKTFDQVPDLRSRLQILKHYKDTQSGKREREEVKRRRKKLIEEKTSYNTLKVALLRYLYEYLDNRLDVKEVIIEIDPMFEDVVDMVLTDPEITLGYICTEVPRNEDKLRLGLAVPRIVRFGIREI